MGLSCHYKIMFYSISWSGSVEILFYELSAFRVPPPTFPLFAPSTRKRDCDELLESREKKGWIVMELFTCLMGFIWRRGWSRLLPAWGGKWLTGSLIRLCLWGGKRPFLCRKSVLVWCVIGLNTRCRPFPHCVKKNKWSCLWTDLEWKCPFPFGLLNAISEVEWFFWWKT